jgi:hypothetical protein
LKVGTLEIPKGLVLIFGTCLADIYKEFNERVNGCIGHAGRISKAVALYQATDYPCTPLYAQSVHVILLMTIMLERIGIAKKKN